ncbi:hypothetical protein M2454_002802 [Aequitasia blattaphilus]|uniref:AP2/ERF domain-containing protein n=1 Tax=Aequitasia blattaphilus TaxID=2949332 RepID=A0ABT1EF47_9FIRM|nr:hypothetical protein [Aequitasia blattaphilus]MCP1103461.1 hypothetical protein [Aequitasia blattaphilus]MCR8616101.1 hypothetical protein [Aequitasia blattaphilus]
MHIELDELMGLRFGQLEVISAYRDEKKRIKCKVKCECGKEKECFYTNLKNGRTKSCGHLERENRKTYIDLAGQTYGELRVIQKTEERKEGCVVWECQCSCGETVYASRRQLARGYVTQCHNHKEKQLIGSVFESLTVQDYSDERKAFLCQCSCGKEIWASKKNLLSGHTKSCGHLRHEDSLTRIEGVAVSTLRRKKPRNNTSGIVGVSKNKKQKWVSYITFKGKRYTLGEFEDKRIAIAERKKAESKYFEPYLRMEKELKI